MNPAYPWLALLRVAAVCIAIPTAVGVGLAWLFNRGRIR